MGQPDAVTAGQQFGPQLYALRSILGEERRHELRKTRNISYVTTQMMLEQISFLNDLTRNNGRESLSL